MQYLGHSYTKNIIHFFGNSNLSMCTVFYLTTQLKAITITNTSYSCRECEIWG